MAFLNVLDLLINSDLGSFHKRESVYVLDSASTSIPDPAASQTLDNMVLHIGQRVLFTALTDATKNNKIYKIHGKPTLTHTDMEFHLEMDGMNVTGAPETGDLVQVQAGSSAEQLWAWDGHQWLRVDFTNISETLETSTGAMCDILLTTNGGHTHSALLTIEQVQSLTEGEVSSVDVTSTLDAAHTHTITVTWDGISFQGTIADNHGHTFEIPINSSKFYIPGNSSDWSGTAPTTITEALDRLAAVVKVLNSGTGA